MSETLIDDIKAAIPVSEASVHLTYEHYQQLLVVWRQQTQQLLAANTNKSSVLSILQKVSHYLWQTVSDDDLQCLWYLATLWLNDLAHNETPLPERYATILAQLDKTIEAGIRSTPTTAERLTQTSKDLVATIYAELTSLEHSSERTQALLMDMPQSAAQASRFLPYVLSELETIIFGLSLIHI